MKKIKKILLPVLLVVLIGGLGTIGYFIYDSIYFLTTQNSQLAADMVTITPEVTGKVVTWDAKEGDNVKIGQILGRQDLGMLMTSSAINPQALNNTADALASKSAIKSPINGKVIKSNVVEGQVAAAGMDLATVADIANVYVNANIEETSINKIKAGQKVDIKVDAFSGKSFTGHINSVGKATQSTFGASISLNTSGEYSKVTQLIPVKIAIENPEKLELLPGMNTTVKIHIK